MRALLTTVVALTLSASALAQLPSTSTAPPTGGPGTPVQVPVGQLQPGGPQFLKISGVSVERKAVAIMVMEATPVTVEKEVPVQVNRGGQNVIEVRKVQVTEYRMVEKKTEMSLKGVVGMDGAGNKLTDEQLWTRLAGRKMVLISHNREGLDAAYRDVIARDAVILIMPAPDIAPVPAPLPELPPARLPPVKN